MRLAVLREDVRAKCQALSGVIKINVGVSIKTPNRMFRARGADRLQHTGEREGAVERHDDLNVRGAKYAVKTLSDWRILGTQAR